MAVIRIVELSCDADGCDIAYQPTPAELTSLQLTRIGSIAAGWRTRGGSDYCPKHEPPDVARVRELVAKRLTDAQIGARLGRPYGWVFELRREYGIPAGLGRTGRPSALGGAR